MANTTLPYKGNARNLVTFDVPNSKVTYYGYIASTTEAARIEKKYGVEYITKSTNGTPIVIIGGYSDNTKNVYNILPPGFDKDKLNGVTNETVSYDIQLNSSFFKNATGNPPPNTATTNPNSENQPTGSFPPPEDTAPNVRSGSNYMYPKDLHIEQDYIKFEVWKLRKTPNKDFNTLSAIDAFKSENMFGITAEKNAYTPKGISIILPIQSSIVDQNSVNWGSGEINEIQRILAKESANMMTTKKNPAEAFAGGITNLMKYISDNQPQAKNILYTALLEQAVGVPGLLSRLTGGVLNPNMELLFQGPQLRPFNFTFKMSPRSKEEADDVKGIIRTFKKNMAPEVKGLFLQAPCVFRIQYYHGGEIHKSINLIKMCALQNCSVDYTPLQTYMTYDDTQDPEASMVSYNMTLTFSEITPIYQQDYDAPDVVGHSIGF